MKKEYTYHECNWTDEQNKVITHMTPVIWMAMGHNPSFLMQLVSIGVTTVLHKKMNDAAHIVEATMQERINSSVIGIFARVNSILSKYVEIGIALRIMIRDIGMEGSDRDLCINTFALHLQAMAREEKYELDLSDLSEIYQVIDAGLTKF